VAASGVRFAYLKGGNGNDGVDPMLRQNARGCAAAGIPFGVYGFFYPLPNRYSGDTRDPVAQANAHWGACLDLGAQLPPALDLEWPSPESWVRWGVTAEEAKARALAYLVKMEALSGRTPLVYTYPYFAKALGFTDEFIRYPLWLASYSKDPAPIEPWAGWTIWQQTGGGGKLPSGAPVDTNVIADESTLAGLVHA
jgi:lysozyme